ncbi:MAG: hypothetical protein DRR42_26105 [Gammaproteobacteria bacterium]|nr:MAG: hypothetical protein DRR42_26105 [Gammaproteobacteria bacterium]
MSDYIVRELGIKAFVEATRIDFILQTPGVDKKLFPRVTAKRAEPEAKLTLAGKPFSVDRTHFDSEGAATGIEVSFGNRTEIKLGRCTKSSGTPSFYRGLEASNSTAPKTEAELADVLSAWGAKAPLEDQGPEGDDYDDDIPF